MRGEAPPSLAEQLRLALVDLQEANRAFVRSFADPEQAQEAARVAHEARTQAAHWAALLRETETLDR